MKQEVRGCTYCSHTKHNYMYFMHPMLVKFIYYPSVMYYGISCLSIGSLHLHLANECKKLSSVDINHEQDFSTFDMHSVYT